MIADLETGCFRVRVRGTPEVSSHVDEANQATRVASEIAAGDSLSLSQAAKVIGVGYDTVLKYATRGLRAGSDRLFIETAKFGGRYRTSAAAIQRFMVRQSGDIQQIPDNPRVTAKQAKAHQAEHEAAKAKLRAWRL